MRTVNGIGTTAYGRAKVRPLSDAERAEVQARYAESYVPYSYQVIEWFTIVWLPVFPLRCLRVINTRTAPKIVWGVSPEFLATEVPMDWAQMASHYAIFWFPFLAALWAFGVFG